MIIKRLTLHNFGVYAGTNTFEFTNKKPIVLIGGMNGRGKTTFLEAVLLAVYGRNSKAYKESRYKSFEEYLRSFVNRNDETLESFIEIEFVLNSVNNEVYLVNRSWNDLQKHIKEKVIVKKNYVEDVFLTENWTMFVESIIPSALSGFYFFDGEKIAELAVNDSDLQMKESIRSMLGISVLDVLESDIKKCQKKLSKNSKNMDSSEKIDKIRNKIEAAKKELSDLETKYINLRSQYDLTTERIENLKYKYSVKGGNINKKIEELNQSKIDIQAELLHVNESLILSSSDILPLVMVKDFIQEIKLQAEDEHNDLILREAIEQINILYEDYCSDCNGKNAETEKFIEYLKQESASNVKESLYELSEHALFQVNDLLENKFKDNLKNVEVLLENKKNLNKKLEDIENYLSQSIDEKELKIMTEKIKEENDNLQDIKVSITEIESKMSELKSVIRDDKIDLDCLVEKFLKNTELKDDSERKMKYSNIALSILEKYSIELQKRKTSVLAETITECYHKLANKKDMIDRIIMDSQSLNIEYLDENNNKVNKDSLSAGEKQLMVICILWALAICSKKCLPVIIDTPLSRMDSLHRISLIKTYFPEASEQTIILSTDSEITGEYYDLIKDNVGDEFTLVYDEETKSTTINRGYFGEAL